jgi:succinoglycan biosynthesis transport protein ExoP
MFENNQSLTRYPRPRIPSGNLAAMEPQSSAQMQLSIADIGRTLARRWILILGFTVFSVCTMAIYAFMKTPVYEGVARLQIDPMRSSSLGLDDPDKSVSPDVDGRLKTEVEIIRSSTVATHVMDSLGLHANPHFAGPDTVSTDVKNLSTLLPPLRRRLLDRFSSSLTVSVVPNTQIVEIRFRNSDAVLAADTANSIIEEYVQRNFQARIDGTAQVSQWLSKQMGEIKNSTAVSQQKLAEFERENNLLGSNESDNIVTDRLKQINEELTQIEADRIVKEGRYRLADSGDPELIGSTVPSTTLPALRNQQAELQAQYALLSAKYGGGYPKLQELQAQLALLAVNINAERINIKIRLENDYNAAAKTEGMIRKDFEKQKAEAFNLNEHATQYAILKHEVESGQQLYDTLQFKMKEASVTSGLTSSYVSVIDRAELPQVPVEPRRKFYLALGLGGGLFGGVLLGLIWNSFDDTIGTAAELEAVTDLPELASVPTLEMLSTKNQQASIDGNLLELRSKFESISITEPHGVGAEAYRSLCSVILLSSLKNPPKVIVVTSAMPGEGKSTVTCNLARAIAQRRKNVLLVDGDLRCSSPYARHARDQRSSPDFSESATVYQRYQPFADLPNLTVVSAGSRQTGPAEILAPTEMQGVKAPLLFTKYLGPAEILASTEMQELMAKWRAEYDHVIVDTPPVLPFADALIMSALADGVILVARSEVCRINALLRARYLLARSGANIIGFVLNAAKRRESYYDYPGEYKSMNGNGSHVSSR